MSAPGKGSRWGYSGVQLGYTVLHVTNTAHQHERHPPDVVYQGDNGNVWSMPLSGWPGKLMQVAAPAPATPAASVDTAWPDAWHALRDDVLSGVDGLDNDQVNIVLGMLDNYEPAAVPQQHAQAALSDYSYQQIFDAIAAATKIESAWVSISVSAFREALAASRQPAATPAQAASDNTPPHRKLIALLGMSANDDLHDIMSMAALRIERLQKEQPAAQQGGELPQDDLVDSINGLKVWASTKSTSLPTQYLIDRAEVLGLLAQRAASVPAQAASEIERGLAERDAALFGTGYLVDGKRVAPEGVTVVFAAPVPAASVPDAEAQIDIDVVLNVALNAVGAEILLVNPIRKYKLENFRNINGKGHGTVRMPLDEVATLKKGGA